MNNTSNINIDYQLFSLYDREYFIKNKIIPIKEDTISLSLIICKESNLNDVNNNFTKLLKFREINIDELLFHLSFLEIKIDLFNTVNSIIFRRKK